jgi:hypothetical protein
MARRYTKRRVQWSEHGFCGTRTYRAWENMKTRCNNAKYKDFSSYGGRGISICERWNKFVNFLADMGPCPSGLTLERRDVNGNYEPGNCYWESKHRQLRNRRDTRLVSFNDETKCLKDWTEQLGLNYKAVFSRITKLGWGEYRALTTPTRSTHR